MTQFKLNQSVAVLAGLAVVVPLIAFALEPSARPPGFYTTHELAIQQHRLHHGKVSLVRLLRPHGHAILRQNVTAPERAKPHQKPRLRQPSNENQRGHDQYQEEEQYWQEALDREHPLEGAEMVNDEVRAPSLTTTSLIRLMPNEPAAGSSNAPPVATTDGDRDLLCLFRVYMDSFVSIGKVDMNDRLVFLVPLIIIYWQHRHPHHALPYSDLDNLLRDIGPEGQVHRVVLQEVSKRVGTECVRENGPLASTLSRQHNKQTKAVEAMRILREWLDQEERLEEQTARQSGAREIRHWFKDLVAAHKRRSEAAPALTPTVQPTRVAPASTALPRDELAHETTTDLYGLPNFENRTRDYKNQTGVTTPRPTGMNMTLLNELNQLQPSNSNSSSTSGAVSRSSGGGGGGGGGSMPPTHYGEFFDLVTSIIDEINVLHNSTAAIMALHTTSPTLV